MVADTSWPAFGQVDKAKLQTGAVAVGDVWRDVVDVVVVVVDGFIVVVIIFVGTLGIDAVPVFVESVSSVVIKVMGKLCVDTELMAVETVSVHIAVDDFKVELMDIVPIVVEAEAADKVFGSEGSTDVLTGELEDALDMATVRMTDEV